jgi:hypothetical protein
MPEASQIFDLPYGERTTPCASVCAAGSRRRLSLRLPTTRLRTARPLYHEAESWLTLVSSERE